MPRSPASLAPTSKIVVYQNGGDLKLDEVKRIGALERRIRKANRVANGSPVRLASSDRSRLRRSGMAGMASSFVLWRRIIMQNLHKTGRAATPRESTDARASRTRVSRGMLALAKSRVQQLAPPAPKPKPKIGFAQARR